MASCRVHAEGSHLQAEPCQLENGDWADRFVTEPDVVWLPITRAEISRLIRTNAERWCCCFSRFHLYLLGLCVGVFAYNFYRWRGRAYIAGIKEAGTLIGRRTAYLYRNSSWRNQRSLLAATKDTPCHFSVSPDFHFFEWHEECVDTSPRCLLLELTNRTGTKTIGTRAKYALWPQQLMNMTCVR